MWKKVVFVAVALALTGSTIVYAQRAGRDHGERWRPSAADMSAFTDARIAGLKAGLKLTPEQETSWPAFEQAMRDLAKLRAERRQAWLDRERTWFDRDRNDRAGFDHDRNDRAGLDRDRSEHTESGTAVPAESPIDRLQRRADVLSSNGAALKKLADAAAPLYASLDDAQKQRFLVLARDIAPRRQRFASSDDDRGAKKFERMDHGGRELR